MEQLPLLTGFFRCHNCGHDTERTRKFGRFHLCDACWAQILPQWEKRVLKPGREPAWYADTEEQRAVIEVANGWLTDQRYQFPLSRYKMYLFFPITRLPMETVPPDVRARMKYHTWQLVDYIDAQRYHHVGERPLTAEETAADTYYPWCECGAKRQPVELTRNPQKGLWGGPLRPYCQMCQAKREIDAVLKWSEKIHPDWDDEQWLDFMYQMYRKAFDLGVLPDYWFVLRGRK